MFAGYNEFRRNMGLKIDYTLNAKKLTPKVHRLFELSAAKILSLEKSWNPSRGTPVFTGGPTVLITEAGEWADARRRKESP